MNLFNNKNKKGFTQTLNSTPQEFSKPKTGINLISGFTLVEIMVSLTLFTFVVTIFGSSLFGVFEGNRKSRSLQSVMDNLNLSLESMTRSIRFGSRYHCDVNQGVISSPRDCSSGSSSIAILDSDGNQIVYRQSGSRIVRSINGGAEQNVTSSDVSVLDLRFFVLGSTPYDPNSFPQDLTQPRVIMLIRGRAGTATALNRSEFRLQTTVSQRLFDVQ